MNLRTATLFSPSSHTSVFRLMSHTAGKEEPSQNQRALTITPHLQAAKPSACLLTRLCLKEYISLVPSSIFVFTSHINAHINNASHPPSEQPYDVWAHGRPHRLLQQTKDVELPLNIVAVLLAAASVVVACIHFMHWRKRNRAPQHGMYSRSEPRDGIVNLTS